MPARIGAVIASISWLHPLALIAHSLHLIRLHVRGHLLASSSNPVRITPERGILYLAFFALRVDALSTPTNPRC